MAEIAYPIVPTTVRFELTDGVGLQAFVVLVSAKELPPFSNWRARLGDLPWRPTSADRAWRFDGVSRRRLGDVRGELLLSNSVLKPFTETCDVWAGRGNIDTVYAMAFPVVPAANQSKMP